MAYNTKPDMFLTLREQEVRIEYSIAPAEPDVGLMREGIDEYTVYDMDGNMLDWELTDSELDKLCDQVFD